METYMRFRDKIGPHCGFCKAAAKAMFVEEINRDPQFIADFKDGKL